MKYTFAAIILISVGLFIAVAMSGHEHASDKGILIVAIVSVCFFGALPVVMGARKAKTQPPRRIVSLQPPATKSESTSGGTVSTPSDVKPT